MPRTALYSLPFPNEMGASRLKESVSSRLYINAVLKPASASVSPEDGATVSPSGSCGTGVGVGSGVNVGKTGGVGLSSSVPPGAKSPEKTRISRSVRPVITARKMMSTPILRTMYLRRRTAARLFLRVCFRLAILPSLLFSCRPFAERALVPLWFLRRNGVRLLTIFFVFILRFRNL